MWLSSAPGGWRAIGKSVSATKDWGCSCLFCHLVSCANDLLKRGGKREGRDLAAGQSCRRKVPRRAWLGLAGCLCVCLPPSFPVR